MKPSDSTKSGEGTVSDLTEEFHDPNAGIVPEFQIKLQ